jgi:hypothetical protein
MFSITNILIGALLVLIQFAAALPWLAAAFLGREGLRDLVRRPFAPWVLQRLGFALGCALVLPVVVLAMVQDREALERCGHFYSAVLQLQITLDLFIFAILGALWLWPKGGAVALAAFREGARQWMFWLLLLLAAGAMGLSVFIPYFTFGEDYLMVKQLGYDTIMLVAVLFGTLAASLSISEEIEGRTAITLMSKPVSRRQFLLGKFLGIIFASGLMVGLLAPWFEGALLFKHHWDKLGSLSEESARETARLGVVLMPAWMNDALRDWALPAASTDFLRGCGQWAAHTFDTMPGLILSFAQVMVLVAIAVALATRMPMVVNLPTVLVIYFLAHLTPVLLARANKLRADQPDAAMPRLLGFVAQVFDTVLPDLGSFKLDPALVSDTAPPARLFASYVGSVALYGIVYTGIVLLFGLILFEDRDLA